VRDVLVDASALIALLDRDDPEHERCVDAMKQIHDPLVTVWPALTEAMHMLADAARARETLCDLIVDGVVRLVTLESSDLGRIKQLMQKYHDVPMDFADAALVYAAERERLTRIVTFDRHFEIYGLPRRGRFTVLPSRTPGA
jgi:uncharacterized protein